MKHSDSMAAIGAALVKAQAEIKAVPKDSTNPHFRSKFASLDAITDAIKPVLSKHGLAVIQGTTPTTDEAGLLTALVVETMVLHSSGEWISNAIGIPLDKATAQGAGSATTYGRRYGLAAFFAITNDEDDDGNEASERSGVSKAADMKSRPAPREGAASEQTGGHTSIRATEKLMPFGKTKGQALGNLGDSELEKTVAWCRSTDEKKFASLIADIESVLDGRNLRPVASGVGVDADPDSWPGALDDPDDSSLPF